MVAMNVNNFEAIKGFCGEEKAEALIAYLQEILAINEHINLTSIRDFQEACLLHLEDSLVALPEVMAARGGKYADIGCGGGFPGVPLGVSSGKNTTLVDSRAKKIKVVMDAIEKSKVGRFADFQGEAARIEDFGRDNRGEFAIVTARALSSLPSLLELAAPLLEIGGSFVALKSEIDADEEAWGTVLAPKLGLELASKRKLTLTDEETKRIIYTFRKVGESKIKLPRKVGLAQKSPLRPHK